MKKRTVYLFVCLYFMTLLWQVVANLYQYPLKKIRQRVSAMDKESKFQVVWWIQVLLFLASFGAFVLSTHIHSPTALLHSKVYLVLAIILLALWMSPIRITLVFTAFLFGLHMISIEEMTHAYVLFIVAMMFGLLAVRPASRPFWV